ICEAEPSISLSPLYEGSRDPALCAWGGFSFFAPTHGFALKWRGISIFHCGLGQPRSLLPRYTQGETLKMTTTDHVSLFCLGNPPNPPGGLRFLNGLVQADHSVRLIEFINTLSSSMLWTRRAIGEFWTLQCDGAPPPGVNPGPLFLFGFASGSVLIVPP